MTAHPRKALNRPHVAAISGMGAFTPFGPGVDRFLEAAFEGRDAFGRIALFPAVKHRTAVAAEARDLPVFLPRRLQPENLSRADRFALAAAREALEQAGLLGPDEAVNDPERIGVVVGTAAGGILGLEAFFRLRAAGRPVSSPRALLSSFALSALAANLARAFDLRGPRLTTATVCSSSALALAVARDWLGMGRLDRVLVVGSESLSEVTHAGFNALRSVAPDRCRPFDLHRNGLVLGEGAGALVLEAVGAAQARGVEALGFLTGCGITTDTHHFTAPQPDGEAVFRAMAGALAEGGVAPEAVSCINAHGTGTPLNDRAEARGIHRLFGAHARRVPVSSTKSVVGHALGAAGILEALVTLAALREGRLPPTAGLETPDPACDLLLPSRPKTGEDLPHGLSNALAFGGSCVSLLFGRDGGPGVEEKAGDDGPAPAPVITGLGVVSPLGLDREAFARALAAGDTGAKDLGPMGEAWAGHQGGLVDTGSLKERIPVRLRRRMNRPATLLFAAFQEALEDARLARGFESMRSAVTYGSAWGCSGSVHAFYSGLLQDGPAFGSPHEFSLSVTNAPPSLISQFFRLTGPLWVFAADEASWDASLHWACDRVQKGLSDVVAVCGAEELSGSILAIHQALGLLRAPGGDHGLMLGEGALCMVVESETHAQDREAAVYGSIEAWHAAGDSRCGPLDFSPDGARLLDAAEACLEKAPGKTLTTCISPANGNPDVERAANEALQGLEKAGGRVRPVALKPRLGESGIAGGWGLAAALLDPDAQAEDRTLVLTAARGGLCAATLVKRSEARDKASIEGRHA